MSFNRLPILLFGLMFCFSACQQPQLPEAQTAPTPVKRYDRPNASILKGVEVPAGKRLFISSGQVTAPNDMNQPEKSLARYGKLFLPIRITVLIPSL